MEQRVAQASCDGHWPVRQPLIMPSASLVDLVEKVLARAPEWVRVDLVARDPLQRQRAEETLAAMIASAISSTGDPESS